MATEILEDAIKANNQPTAKCAPLHFSQSLWFKDPYCLSYLHNHPLPLTRPNQEYLNC